MNIVRSVTSLFFIWSMTSQLFDNKARAEVAFIDTIHIRPYSDEPISSNTLINLQNNEQAKNQSLADVLRSVPGVEVVRQGGVGQTTTVFIRGARSEDTLVLIDGINLNDAMSPGAGFDFSTMSLDNIDRIEIIRGPQSFRYGSGALGGVINIITTEGRAPTQINYLTEIGSYNTARASVTVSGKNKSIGYSLSASHLKTAGFSAAAEQLGNKESDASKVSSSSLKVNWTPTSTQNFQTVLRYSEADVDIDSKAGTLGDDPNNKTSSKQIITGFSATERFFSERLKASLGLSHSDFERNGENTPDALNSTNSRDHFKSTIDKAHTDITWYLEQAHTLRLGLSAQTTSGSNQSNYDGSTSIVPQQNQSLIGESLAYAYESPTWIFDIGTRLDQSSQDQSVHSYRTSIGRLFPTTQFKALITYGTGYKLPSLYQLFSIYGQKDLKQETAESFEIYLEKYFSSDVVVNFSAFENRYSALIDFDMLTSKYFNLSKATSRGFELQAAFEANKNFEFSATSTLLDTKDESTGLKLLRRPEFVWGLKSAFKQNAYEAAFQYSYRNSRDDIDPDSLRRIQMSPYSLIALGGSFEFRTALKLYARIENLLDTNYAEVAGYGTAQRSYFIGLTGQF